MRMKFWMAAALVGVSACSDTQHLVAPRAEPASSEAAGPRAPSQRSAGPSVDAELERLAERAPGFGGFFLDDEGVLNVYTRDAQPGAAVRDVIRQHVRDRMRGGAAAVPPLRFVSGDYDFRELAGWLRTFRESTDMRGVTLTSVDERRNRVRIGVVDAAARSRVLQALGASGVPAGAVVVEEVAPFVIGSNLHATVRPVIGGVKIASGGGECTLGVNVRRGHLGVYETNRYFVTNSHCTLAFGSVTPTVIGQPTASAQIGQEHYDHPLHGCYGNRLCRWSDASLIRYDAGIGWQLGKIAQVGASSPFPITGSVTLTGYAYIWPGGTVHKVGQRTGHSSGTVSDRCVDIQQWAYDSWGNLYDTGRTMLCQTTAGYHSQAGDSGSPVYTPAAGSHSWVGIHWGGNGQSAVYSPYDNVSWELTQDMMDEAYLVPF